MESYRICTSVFNISLSIKSSRFNMFQKFSFSRLNTLFYIYDIFCLPIYLSVDIWVVSTFLAIYEQCWYRHWVTKSVQIPAFNSLEFVVTSRIADNIIAFFFFFEEPLYCFLWWLYHFTSPLTVYKGSNFPLALILFWLLIIAIVNGYEDIISVVVGLHFPIDWCPFKSFAHF